MASKLRSEGLYPTIIVLCLFILHIRASVAFTSTVRSRGPAPGSQRGVSSDSISYFARVAKLSPNDIASYTREDLLTNARNLYLARRAIGEKMKGRMTSLKEAHVHNRPAATLMKMFIIPLTCLTNLPQPSTPGENRSHQAEKIYAAQLERLKSAPLQDIDIPAFAATTLLMALHHQRHNDPKSARAIFNHFFKVANDYYVADGRRSLAQSHPSHAPHTHEDSEECFCMGVGCGEKVRRRAIGVSVQQ